MSAGVTPDTGEGPYQLSVTVDPPLPLPEGYEFVVVSGDDTGSCPSPGGLSDPVTGAAAALASEGTFEDTAEVAAGDCRTYRIDLVRVEGSEVIDTATFEVDNT